MPPPMKPDYAVLGQQDHYLADWMVLKRAEWLESEVVRLRERVQKLETPQWYLREGDDEGSEELEYLFRDCQPGGVYPVDCGTHLPRRWVTVLADPEDEDGVIVLDFPTEAEARAALEKPEEAKP